MNIFFEAPSLKAETGDFRRADVGVAGNVNRISLNQGHPMPLWLKARAWTIGFRHDDLERTHWQKVCRSMQDD